MDESNRKNRVPMQPRVRGTKIPGAHPADLVIRRERYPYAAEPPMAGLLKWLVGSPIATSRAIHERLTKVKALAVFSSDALSSVAYATEEILLVLVLAGAGAFSFSLPISLTIAVLLFIVAVSYNQTIHAYPSGGGAYIVAKDNLGTHPGLVAGAALLIDYVLTVAVSVSSGVSAMVSAFPELETWRVGMAVGFVMLIALANLRGLRESSSIFMVPTYAFIFSVLLLIASGLFRYYVLNQTSVAPTTNVLPREAVEGLGLFLILRAFAAGCTALTGVEAISNGVPAFKPPESQNAARTLSVMAALLITMFVGITYLTRIFPVVPEPDHETVLSQLGRTVFGENALWLFLQATTTLILVLAANTSFADFPRLSAIMARDGFLPHVFVRVGQRLVFSSGILALAFLAIVLIVAFGASTHNLIPLYAIGVFVSFTLSQAGMVTHWWKLRAPHWRRSIVINGIGATATAIVTSVLVATKFGEGAYIVVLLIPFLILVFTRIKHHYDLYHEQVRLDGYCAVEQMNIVIVPVARVDLPTARTLSFARTLGDNITAVFVTLNPQEGEQMVKEWQAAGFDVPLKLVESPYRSVTGSLLKYIDAVGAENPDCNIVVVLPEIVPHKLWHTILHNQTAQLIKLTLLFQPKRIVVSVPYHLER